MNNILNELRLQNRGLLVTVGSIEFPDYENLLSQVELLADRMSTVEVTEDNLKDSKRMVAAVSKEVNELNAQRLDAKRAIMKPYDDLEVKFKHITSIIRDAEEAVRVQVRELEEEERQDKRRKIKSIFKKREGHHKLYSVVGFEHFIQNRHMNKSVSMDTVEKEMVEWLLQAESDIEYISTLEHSGEVYHEYSLSQNLSQAIKKVDDKMKRIAEMERRADEEKKTQEEQQKVSQEVTNDSTNHTESLEEPQKVQECVFKVTGAEHIRIVTAFMESMNIQYVNI